MQFLIDKHSFIVPIIIYTKGTAHKVGIFTVIFDAATGGTIMWILACILILPLAILAELIK